MTKRGVPRILIAVVLAAAGGAAQGQTAGRIELLHNPFGRPNLEALGSPSAAQASVPMATQPGSDPAAPREGLPDGWELRGILMASGHSVVNVNGKLLAVGETYQGYRLVRVEERKAVFTRNGLIFELPMTATSRQPRTTSRDEAPPPEPTEPPAPKSDKPDDAPPPEPRRQ